MCGNILYTYLCIQKVVGRQTKKTIKEEIQNERRKQKMFEMQNAKPVLCKRRKSFARHGIRLVFRKKRNRNRSRYLRTVSTKSLQTF